MPWKDIWSAGHGVGRIKEVQSVAEVIFDLKKEYFLANKEMNFTS